MDNAFQSRVLTMAANLIKPVKTTILDKVFGRKKGMLNSVAEWDIKAGSERVLESVSVHAEAQVEDGLGRKNVTAPMPRFAKKRFIAAADLEKIRGFGTLAPQMLNERIGDEQRDMRTNVDLTREFMAAKALTGQVVDANGKVLVDYHFEAEQKPALTGAAAWTDADGDPLKNIRAWKKRISQNTTAVTGFYAFCGSGAMDALMDNEKASEKLKYVAGAKIAEQGRITHFGGIEIEEYFGSYLDDNGDRVDIIPENGFLLVGAGSEVAAELYAPVIDLKAPSGVGKGKKAQLFFSKSWELEDPSGRWIKVEARPLPVLIQPTAVVFATVA